MFRRPTNMYKVHWSLNGLRMSWSDFVDMQSDLGLTFHIWHNDSFLMLQIISVSADHIIRCVRKFTVGHVRLTWSETSQGAL